MNEKLKKKKKWIIGGVVLVVVIVAALLSGEKGEPVRAAAVGKGKIDAYVEERARTTLPRVWRLTMPFAGRIEPITHQEGTPVKKGEVVARLDTDNLKTSYRQLTDALKAFDSAVAASKTKITASKAVEEYAKWLARAQESLYQSSKLVSEMDVKSAEKDSVQAQEDFLESRLMYYAMEAFNAAMKLLPIYVRRDLDRSEIASPIDGVVLKRYVENEKVLSAGDPLLDIGDLAQLEVTADILSEEVVAVKVGDPVEIYGSAVGSKPIRGKVIRVKPEGFTKVSSLGVEQQRVSVKVAFDQDDLEKLRSAGRKLGVEYRVWVRIITESKGGALIVPRTALIRGNGGKWQVFAVKDGKAELTDVEVGLTNDHQAEITGGLKEREVVVIAPPSTLTSGTRVSYDKLEKNGE